MSSTTTCPEFEIVLAQPSDAAVVASLGAAVWTTSYGWSVSHEDAEAYIREDYSTQAWEKVLVDSDSTTYVARSKGSDAAVLGFIQLKRNEAEPSLKDVQGSAIMLNRLYIDTKMHGRGLGKTLINFVFTKSQEEGFDNMWLGVWEKCESAQRLYAKMGFEKIGEHGFPVGKHIHNDWILLKKL